MYNRIILANVSLGVSEIQIKLDQKIKNDIIIY